MPEWGLQLIAGTLLAALGWLIVNKLNRIDRKLDRYEERQAQVEKDCLTWKQFEAEMGKQVDPLWQKTDRLGERLTIVETRCREQHK